MSSATTDAPSPTLFAIESAKHDAEEALRRIWLVVAHDAEQACALVPADFRIGDISIAAATADGPSRVIGWSGPPSAK